MKRFLIIIAMLLSALLLVACEGDGAPSTTPSTNGGENPEPHTHLFGEWQTVKEATCTEEGSAERACECGEKETKRLDTIEHTYTATVIAPTCMESGYTSYECICGKNYKADKTQKVGHEFGEWVVVTASTCQVKGSERSDCKNCEHYVTRELELSGHKFGDWTVSVAPTCEAKGEEKRVCTYGCGSAEAREVDSLGGHSMGEWIVTRPATCTENGAERRECKNNGCEKHEVRVINGSHDMGSWKVTLEPTCQSNGTERRDCNNCSHFEARQIPSHGGHNYGEWKVTVSATCTIVGERRRECQNPGCDSFEREDVYDGHAYGNWSTHRPATCTTKGEERRSCSKCGHTETRAIEAEHSWGEWYSSSTIEEKRTCAKCSLVETRVKFSGSMSATGVAAIQIVNTPYVAGSTEYPYRRQGGCYNGVNAYQALITKNEELGKIMKKNVITGETTFSEYVPLGHADDVFYLPTTNCIYLGSGSEHHVFDADTLEYKGKQTLGNSTGCLFYMPSTNTYINSSGTVYDASFQKISSISKQAGENIGKTVQGHCADEKYIYELRCQGIGNEKYYTYVQIHTTDGKYVGTVTVKIPENFEPENISVVDGELYIGACSTQPVVTFYKVVFD